MKPEEDAYGQLLWALYNGKNSVEILERDDGYISAYSSPNVYVSSYEDWKSYEKKAMEFVKGRVLDVGCGAGRHSLYLQEKGYDVFGIDISPLAIKICKLRGLKKAQVLAIEDIRFKPDSFDTILMMCNGFGLFGTPKNAQKLLRTFYNMSNKNALIIAQTNDPYKTDNSAHLDHQKSNRKQGRMSGHERVRLRYEKYATEWFDHLLVSKEEMKKILNGTGWKIKEFLDSEDSHYIAIINKINR